MNYKFYLEQLQGILSKKRLEHSINTANIAVKLAERYGECQEKARVAGLLHDCARDMGSQELLAMAQDYCLVIDDIEFEMPVLLHARLGALLAKKRFGVNDDKILKAITLHTLGEPEMGLLDKIVYLADKIEPGRRFPGVESLRKTAFKNLDNTVLQSLDMTLELSIKSKELIHPGAVATRNWLLRNVAKKMGL